MTRPVKNLGGHGRSRAVSGGLDWRYLGVRPPDIARHRQTPPLSVCHTRAREDRGSDE